MDTEVFNFYDNLQLSLIFQENFEHIDILYSSLKLGISVNACTRVNNLILYEYFYKSFLKVNYMVQQIYLQEQAINNDEINKKVFNNFLKKKQF